LNVTDPTLTVPVLETLAVRVSELPHGEGFALVPSDVVVGSVQVPGSAASVGFGVSFSPV
jgi:hypothetical protein